jgi:hypothetical protein
MFSSVPYRGSSDFGLPRNRAHTEMIAGYGGPPHGCLRAFGQNRAGETHGPQESLRDIDRQCEREDRPRYSTGAGAALAAGLRARAGA